MNARALQYVVSLARRHTDALGFVPVTRLADYLQRGQLWLAHDGDAPCGFLVWGGRWPMIRLYQLCIQDDALRLHHGRALVERLAATAAAQDYVALSLWCANDLEAHQFWPMVGFRPLRSRPGGRRRGRWLTQWGRALAPGQQLALPGVSDFPGSLAFAPAAGPLGERAQELGGMVCTPQEERR